MALTKEYYEGAMEYALSKVDEKLDMFQTSFLGGSSRDYQYTKQPGWQEWTDGFWCGMLLLAYEYTGDEKYYRVFHGLNAILAHRAEHDMGLNHHDLGFLYSPSAVADYKLTGNAHSKEIGILAADLLIRRYKPKGEFIQAWGALDDPKNYALIIDCLINLPLLHWASEVTGEEKYREVAVKHLHTALKYVVRPDYTTFYKYHFNPETGEPAFGKTAQGYSDNSCWARGQAWGILGSALNYSYTGEAYVADTYRSLLDCFIRKLPSDSVPYWDMIFADGSGEPRDTSAALAVACGIMEMEKHFHNQAYLDVADEMFRAITEKHMARNLTFPSNVLVIDGMCSRPAGNRPEALPYGDYYYMEYLMRKLRPNWKMYW